MIKDGKLLESTKILDNKGQTVLHHLCGEGDDECVMKILHDINLNMNEIEKKQFINIQNHDGNTAMHIAAQNDNNIIATMLDLYGADKTKVNNDHKIIVASSDSFSDSNTHRDVIKPVIKCGDKIKMQQLVDNLTKATNSDSSSFDINSSDDIVMSDDATDKGNPVSNYLKNLLNGQQGGADIENTDELLRHVENQLSSNVEMTGGATKAKTSATKVKTKAKAKTSATKVKTKVNAKEKTTNVKTSVSPKLSSNELHNIVIKMIQDLGYSDKESKIIKAGLYNYTKEKHPEMNGNERAQKMKEYTTKKYIADIDILAIRQAIEIHYQRKNEEKQRLENMN